jgi:hypothetical protein
MWEEILLDAARGAPPQPGEDEALRHAAACPACGSILQHQRALSERLHNLARQSETLQASPHVEAAVLAGFRSRQRARRHTEAARWLNLAAALALIVSASIFLMRTRIPGPAAATPASVEDLRGFLPVPYRGAPIERGYIVRVNMPRTALVTLGMPLAAGTPETVQADLLLADDGTAHAVRLVR